jgi:adenine-specific DNA-methyltransferase
MQRPKKHAQAMLGKAAQLFRRISPSYSFEQANRDYARWVLQQTDLSGGEKAYNSFDADGHVYQPVSMAAPDKPETRSHRPLLHPVTKQPCLVPAKGWRFPDKSMDELLANGKVVFGSDERTQPRRKYLLKENMYDTVSSLIYYGGSDTALLSSLGIPFDTPKIVHIVKEHVQSMTVDGDIILDFFSGSATTAHAVMQLNAEDGGKRKFIMVQLPELCPQGNDAAKAGYTNICETGKERIRRAGTKIKADNAGKDDIEKLDIGFRVLKLDSSNMKDVYYTPQDTVSAGGTFQLSLDGLIDNIKPDRTAEDLLFQVMLDLGVPLSSKIDQRKIGGKAVFAVADNYLIACFDSATDPIVTEIAKSKPYYAVFRDSSFAGDATLVNFEQIFKTYSPTTKRKVL